MSSIIQSSTFSATIKRLDMNQDGNISKAEMNKRLTDMALNNQKPDWKTELAYLTWKKNGEQSLTAEDMYRAIPLAETTATDPTFAPGSKYKLTDGSNFMETIAKSVPDQWKPGNAEEENINPFYRKFDKSLIPLSSANSGTSDATPAKPGAQLKTTATASSKSLDPQLLKGLEAKLYAASDRYEQSRKLSAQPDTAPSHYKDYNKKQLADYKKSEGNSYMDSMVRQMVEVLPKDMPSAEKRRYLEQFNGFQDTRFETRPKIEMTPERLNKFVPPDAPQAALKNLEQPELELASPTAETPGAAPKNNEMAEKLQQIITMLQQMLKKMVKPGK